MGGQPPHRLEGPGTGNHQVVDVTTPAVSERVIAALAAWHMPKSSALMLTAAGRTQAAHDAIRRLPSACVTQFTPRQQPIA